MQSAGFSKMVPKNGIGFTAVQRARFAAQNQNITVL